MLSIPRPVFWLLLTFCACSTVEAVCNEAETADVTACVTPFITGHNSSFAAIAGTSTCGLTTDCTLVNTAAVCLNTKTLSNGCRLTLTEAFRLQMSAARTVCTVADLYIKCPSATPLNTGSAADHPAGSITFVSLATMVICAILFLLSN